jgi:protein MAK11
VKVHKSFFIFSFALNLTKLILVGLANCLEFFGKTHLFVGLENGNIVIYDTHEWESQKTMKGHTARVNSIAVHPSGLLALSTSKDRTMRLWALKKGVCSHTEKLGFEADKVIWSPKGEQYAVLNDTKVHIFNKVR